MDFIHCIQETEREYVLLKFKILEKSFYSIKYSFSLQFIESYFIFYVKNDAITCKIVVFVNFKFVHSLVDRSLCWIHINR